MKVVHAVIIPTGCKDRRISGWLVWDGRGSMYMHRGRVDVGDVFVRDYDNPLVPP